MIALRFQSRNPKNQHKLWRRQGQAIGAATGRLAIRKKSDAVFAYSYYAEWTFKDLPGDKTRLLHQVHPYAPALKKVYQREIEKNQLLSEQLLEEIEMTIDNEFYEALCEGPRLAHYLTASSGYTKKTLVDEGIAESKITVIPYGADLSKFAVGPGSEGDKCKVLFVGTVSARKGIGYLLQAWKSLHPKSAELIIAGYIPENQRLRQELTLAGVTVLGRVSEQDLINLYQTSSLFCLPSLVEGFGLVYLQSLACGTPILGTEATGAADIVKDHPGVGFIADSGSVESLALELEKALSSDKLLREMRQECALASVHYNWPDFRKRVAQWYIDNASSSRDEL